MQFPVWESMAASAAPVQYRAAARLAMPSAISPSGQEIKQAWGICPRFIALRSHSSA